MPTDRFHIPSESSRPNPLQRSPGRRFDPPAGPRPGSAPTGRSRPAVHPRPALRPLAAAALAQRSVDPTELPQPGEWLWTCRPGAEDDVADELKPLGLVVRPLQAGLVVSSLAPGKRRPPAPSTLTSLAFARQGLPVQLGRQLTGLSPAEAAAALLDGLHRQLKSRPVAVHVFAADSDRGRELSSRCASLHEALSHDLTERGYTVAENGPAAHTGGGQLLMVCLLDSDTTVSGVQLTGVALSLHPGGVQRVRRPADAPSRSAHKLSEALAWLGHGPQSGESCADLGAAPGGWSQVLAERGCPVIAVDTGGLAPGLSRRIKHVRQNAFSYTPDEPVDWLCCDLAYRPLEVAGLLARWGRRRWARFVIANIKLPMKQRVAMLDRVREILASGGWTGLKARQLYHDRDEVTLFAWRGFGLDTRVQYRNPKLDTDTESEATPGGKKLPGSKPSSKTRKGASGTRKGASGTRKGASETRKGASATRKGASETRKGASKTRSASSKTGPGVGSRKEGPGLRKSGPRSGRSGPSRPSAPGRSRRPRRSS